MGCQAVAILRFIGSRHLIVMGLLLSNSFGYCSFSLQNNIEVTWEWMLLILVSCLHRISFCCYHQWVEIVVSSNQWSGVVLSGSQSLESGDNETWHSHHTDHDQQILDIGSLPLSSTKHEIYRKQMKLYKAWFFLVSW